MTGQSTRLAVATLMVLPGGRLETGTPLVPVSPSVSAEIVIKDRSLDPETDPDQFGTGLLVIDATVIMHGAARTPTFVLPPSENEDWVRIALDEFAGRVVYVRFVFGERRRPTALP